MTIAAALELSVLFVCVWGFIAILLTGQIGLGVMLACIAALVVGYYVRRNGWKPSPLVSNVAAIFVLVMAISIFAATLNLLSATVHLFLFLQVTKYITRQTLSEIRWCYLISLFNIIGASVITTTFTFGPVLLVYIFLILISLRLFVIARGFERNTQISAQAALAIFDADPAKQIASRSSAFLSSFFTDMWRRPSAPANARSTRVSLSQMRLPKKMLSSGLGLTFVTVGLSGALFSIIPRLATQNLFQTYGEPKEESSVSAFSENVEFGSFTEIQLDDTIALFVEPESSHRPRYVRMRGVALDSFDGKSWRRSGGSFSQSGRYDYQPTFTTRLYPNTYKFRVLQPAGMTTFLFGDSFPTSMHVPPPYTYQVDRMAQSVWLSEAPPKEFQYQVECMHEDLLLRRDPITLEPGRPPMQLVPSGMTSRGSDDDESVEAIMRFFNGLDVSDTAETTETDSFDDNISGHRHRRHYRTAHRRSESRSEELQSDSSINPSDQSTQTIEVHTNDNPQYWYERRGIRPYRPRTGPERLQYYLQKCLELPENLNKGRVPALAAEWTEDSATTFTKAMAIETRLRTAFDYSLTPKATGNYIENFLFDVRAGHCEYFATSMAVLLRNIGIPARVVNGFYSTEWNALSGNFTVRQKDAHSWVEAWMGDRYGWMTFDPTPPSGVARRNDRGAVLEAFSRMSDAIRMRWYRYVIDYSISDQIHMVRYLSHLRQKFVRAIKDVHIPGITSKEAKTIEQGGLYKAIDWRPIAAAAAIILLLSGWQAVRWILRRRRSMFSVIKFYDDLLKALAHRGITINRGETPREFATRVAGMRPDWGAFAYATDLYYQRKYNESRPNMPSTAKRAKPKYGLTEQQMHQFTALRKAILKKRLIPEAESNPGSPERTRTSGQ